MGETPTVLTTWNKSKSYKNARYVSMVLKMKCHIEGSFTSHKAGEQAF